MGKVTTISVTGASGRTYAFDVYPWGTKFKQLGAVYLVLKKNQTDYSILYIGQTGDLSERFDDHHKASCIRSNGATHIHAHINRTKAARLAEESDLVAKWNPPCNG